MIDLLHIMLIPQVGNFFSSMDYIENFISTTEWPASPVFTHFSLYLGEIFIVLSNILIDKIKKMKEERSLNMTSC